MVYFYNQIGGGNCSLCGSPNTNKSTCPLNPSANKPNLDKHPLAINSFPVPNIPKAAVPKAATVPVPSPKATTVAVPKATAVAAPLSKALKVAVPFPKTSPKALEIVPKVKAVVSPRLSPKALKVVSPKATAKPKTPTPTKIDDDIFEDDNAFKIIPKGTILYRIEPINSFKRPYDEDYEDYDEDYEKQDECSRTIKNIEDYWNRKKFLWFFDNPNDINYYYNNSNKKDYKVITYYEVTKDIKLPRVDNINILKQIEKDLGDWDHEIAGAKNAVRYAFGETYEQNIVRYSHPDIDNEFAAAATLKKWGGYYAPFFRGLGHMEMMLDANTVKKNTRFLSPVCLVSKYTRRSEDDLEACQKLQRCFPNVHVYTISNLEDTQMNDEDFLEIGKLAYSNDS